MISTCALGHPHCTQGPLTLVSNLYRIAGNFRWVQICEDVLVNVIACDHCLYKKGRLRHCCSNLALHFVIVDIDTDLGSARFACVKEEVWQ